tara:strand:- start:1018 stop:1653 length:636 start_codon:yes stop_codon:yes gene_type:complete
MRTKEQQADYRFIPDPDLPAIKITKKRTEQIEKQLPETPQEKLDKIIKKHKINKKDAEILTQNLEIVEFFEKIIEKINPNFALPWITIELLGILNHHKKTLDEVDIKFEHTVELLQLLKNKKITPLQAKDIMRKFIPKSTSPKKQKIKVISDDKKLLKIIKTILKNNKKTIEDYKSGNKQAINFLIGKVMQATNKSADYQVVRKILEKELK